MGQKNDGNPHTIQVEEIKTLRRSDFPITIQKALNAARRAVSDFSKYSKDIEVLIRALTSVQNHIVDQYSNDKLRSKAIKTLVELLGSEREEIKLKSALALLENS